MLAPFNFCAKIQIRQTIIIPKFLSILVDYKVVFSRPISGHKERYIEFVQSSGPVTFWLYLIVMVKLFPDLLCVISVGDNFCGKCTIVGSCETFKDTKISLGT